MQRTSNTRKLQASKFPPVTGKHLKGFRGSRRASLLPALGWEKVTLLQEKHSCPLVFGTLRVWLYPIKEKGSKVNHITTKSTGIGNPEARFQREAIEFLCKIKNEFGHYRIPIFANPDFLCFIILTCVFCFVHTHKPVYCFKWLCGLEPSPKM